MTDDSRRLPAVRPTTVRIDDVMRAELEAEAARLNISPSEWIRRAVVAMLLWERIMRLVQAGASPEHAADPDVMRAALERLAAELEAEAKKQGK